MNSTNYDENFLEGTEVKNGLLENGTILFASKYAAAASDESSQSVPPAFFDSTNGALYDSADEVSLQHEAAHADISTENALLPRFVFVQFRQCIAVQYNCTDTLGQIWMGRSTRNYLFG